MSKAKATAALRTPQQGDPRWTRYPTRTQGLRYRLNRKGDKVFQAHVGGDWITVPEATTEKDAREWKRIEEAKLAQGDRPRSRLKPTFREVADLWFETKRIRENTVAGYRSIYVKHLLPRWADRQIATIREDDIAAVMVDLDRAGKSQSQIDSCLTVCRGIFGHAADRRRRWIPYNTARGLTTEERKGGKPQQEMSWFERDEIAPFLASVRGRRGTSVETLHIFFFALMYTGLRVSELMAIRFQDIDARNGLLRVRTQLGRKGGVLVPLKTEKGHRDVVLADAVLNALLSLRTSMPPQVLIEQPNDFVFQRETGGPLNYQAVRKVFVKARDEAGLSPDLKPHSCRHTYASMMIVDAKVNVVFLSRQLGHSKVSITLDKYAHWFDRVSYAEETRAALERAIARSSPVPEVDTTRGHTAL